MGFFGGPKVEGVTDPFTKTLSRNQEHDDVLFFQRVPLVKVGPHFERLHFSRKILKKAIEMLCHWPGLFEN